MVADPRNPDVSSLYHPAAAPGHRYPTTSPRPHTTTTGTPQPGAPQPCTLPTAPSPGQTFPCPCCTPTGSGTPKKVGGASRRRMRKRHAPPHTPTGNRGAKMNRHIASAERIPCLRQNFLPSAEFPAVGRIPAAGCPCFLPGHPLSRSTHECPVFPSHPRVHPHPRLP